MISFSKLISTSVSWLLRTASDKICIYLLIINIIANFFGIVFFKDTFAIINFILLGAFVAFLETVFIRLFSKVKFIKTSILLLIAIATNILIFTDLFLSSTFNLIVGEDAINIIANTNSTETAGFIETYCSVENLIFLIGAIVLLNAISYKLSKFLCKIHGMGLFNIFLAAGGGLCYVSAYTVKKYMEQDEAFLNIRQPLDLPTAATC